MTAVSILCFVLWLYILRVGYRSKLDFFTFVWGSVGLFIFLMIWVSPSLSVPFSRLVSYVSGLVGQATHLYEASTQLGILFVPNAKSSVISLYIDLECSGIIEIMAFLSMLFFFPVFSGKEKLAIGTGAVVWIFAANILRVFLICLMVYYYGLDAFYLAHSIVGRMVFYVLSIALYFLVFTKSQIKRQKVGGFHYAGNH
ncbi:exosortase family protein XrtG [Caproiciproducens galactitolivorans]|uniref:Exosortase family protein XrtG n=1 Tax=Caproiciproducens galactitolivorans TaxID=642589 RepID=A0ABT4BTW3_9FIRM|nr:exosortase family protein XrtG [Caproiciproducens galactitolivorans]MCY1714348.1 exosortase family protein XrtG [Caproiciproducens galactitolivorans]